MADYPDQPDYQQAVTPGVTRWSPGTEFGNLSWDALVAANTTQNIDYQIPNNGYEYVVDTTFLYTSCLGLVCICMQYCNNYASPTWVIIGSKNGEGWLQINPFTFQSMSLRYPQALRYTTLNPNNVSRWMALYATMYRYLSSA